MGSLKDNGRSSVRRRNRLTVVCTNCKRRKSKCDRKTPCSNCIKFGNADTCVYMKNLKRESFPEKSPDLDHTNHKVTNRLPNQLPRSVSSSFEEVVSNLVSSQEPTVADYMNLSPNRCFVEVKRSAVTMFAPFTDHAITHRDYYLEALFTFRTIAITMTTKTLKGSKKYRENPSLPQSFKPMSIFDEDGDPLSVDSFFRQHHKIHKSLLDKFGKYRKDDSTQCDDSGSLLVDNLPTREYFFDHVLTLFERHILNMVPIFDMDLLKYDINLFYDKWDSNKVISIKEFDHAVCCVILLITKLCILSSHFSKLPLELNEPLTHLDTSKYMAIVHHFLFRMKSLRKCTLLQLQAFILLRFYHWCGPEDGDGNALQQSRIMFGTIIASCQEMGISWMSLLDPNMYWFELFDQSRPSPSIMSPADYKRIYEMIWSYVLYWDRKMCLLNGQECQIGKTFLYGITGQEFSWHQKMLALDHTVLKMSNLLNDMPTKVDLQSLKQELQNACQLFQQIKDDKSKNLHLNYEYQMMLDLFKLCLLHAEVIHYEQTNQVDSFHCTSQLLWDQVVYLSCRCHKFFYGEQNMDPYSRFFTNRIIGVVSDKLCVLIPSLVMRLDRFGKMGFEERNVMVKYLFGICSMYYNELGFDYYRCFMSMFTVKISYKILNRPPNRDSWRLILEFLLHQLEKGSDNALMITHNIPILTTLQENLKPILEPDRDAVKVWNTIIIPIGQSSNEFALDLHKESLQLFLVDGYAKSFNIFASFYDYGTSQLAADAEGTSAKRKKENEQLASGSQDVIATGEIGDPLSWESSVNPDLGGANIELFQEMFEPLDFISFF